MMRPTDRSAAGLSIMWFGMQAVWGALLGISLQARTVALHPAGYVIAYGKIAAAGAAVACVTQIMAGVYSDRLRASGANRIRFYVTGCVLGAAGIYAFYQSGNFTALLWSFMLLQLALNLAIGPYQAIIPDYVAPSRAGVASAWMGAFQSAGNAVGAIIATLVIFNIGKAVALVVVLLCSCALTVADVIKRPLRPISEITIHVRSTALDLFISRALLYVGFYTILGYMLFYLRDVVHASNPQLQSGLVILTFTIFGVFGAAIGGTRADRADRRLVVNAGNALVVCGAVCFIVLHNFGAVVACAAVAGFGWGIFLAADWALGCAVLPLGAMATAMAIWNLAVAGPQIIAPLLTTAVIGVLHPSEPQAPLLAFGLAAAELILGSLWIWRIPGRDAHPSLGLPSGVISS